MLRHSTQAVGKVVCSACARVWSELVGADVATGNGRVRHVLVCRFGAGQFFALALGVKVGHLSDPTRLRADSVTAQYGR
jgi:hypothetical protein